jgi:predicted amino acid racemase
MGTHMLDLATLTIDVSKIEENARTVVSALPGVDIVGVTKVTCGAPEVARAMLAGGVSAIGESRLENVAHMRQAGIAGPFWLLRSPTPLLAEEAVALTDVALVSELDVVAALDAAASRAGRTYRVVVMVDVGDLREGMMPAALPAFLERAEAYEHVEIAGIGISLTCYGAIVPTAENLGLLAQLAETAERLTGRRLLVSGGMSTTLDTFIAGEMPARIDSLRIGEAIVLGVSPASRERILGLHTDALVLSAPVIECQVKPSKPIGTSAQDAFGNRPVFEDQGERRRAICAIGRQDVVPEQVTPVDPRIRVLGASSDHLILDVDDLPEPPRIGDAIEFTPGYSATLALFTSPYVRKEYVGRS